VAYDGPHLLAPKASTGSNTHAGFRADLSSDNLIVQFVVEAIGATPTVTWKIQGSMDSPDGVTGNWYDCGYFTDAVVTDAVAARTATAVGAQVEFLNRPFKWFRLVTSANTNVTYHGELYIDG
jgi:hypothetical protein